MNKLKTVINSVLNWFWNLSLVYQTIIIGILTLFLLLLFFSIQSYVDNYIDNRKDKVFDDKVKVLEDRNKELEKTINEKSGEIIILQKQLEETRKELNESTYSTNNSKKKYYGNKQSRVTTSPSLDNEISDLRSDWKQLYPTDN